MWFRILGPISVHTGRGDAALGGPKQRVVLALLALRANHGVGVDELIDALWADRPPGRPRKTLQVYVANLRRELEEPGRIESGSFGYRLALREDEIDVIRFERLVDSARAAARRSPAAAARDYDEALSLWSAPPLVDLRHNEAIAALTRRHDDLHAAVVEERIALDLLLGGADRAVAALVDLLGADPWRERLWVLLMEAYYRLGRQAAALEAYQQARTRLVEDLGVEPGPELREMERRILTHDPSLADTASPLPEVGTPLDERRSATFVCWHLEGDDLGPSADPEDVLTVVDDFRALVVGEVGAQGGVVDLAQGERLLAWFGHPVAAEDDPVRAVRAALSVVERLGDLGRRVGVRVGVHTGLALFRARSEPTPGIPPDGCAVIGAPSVAERLQLLASPGEVLASASTAALVRGWFELDRPDREGEVDDEVAPVVSVRGVRHRRTDEVDDVVLCGRRGERRAAQAAFERATGGGGPAVVLIRGDAGIGKSALAAAVVADRSSDPSEPVLVVLRCERGRRHEALHPLRTALTSRARGSGDLDLALALGGIPRRRREGAVRVLSAIAGWGPATPAEPAGPAARRSALCTWLAALRGAAPLTLLVEDLHDADDETIEWLEEALDGLVDGCVVLTTRFGGPTPRAARHATVIDLGRLAAPDARELVVRTAGSARLGLSTVNAVLERANGVPLHLRELTLAVVGAPAAAGGPGDVDACVPATLHASLLSRLDQLGPAKEVALRCSVIGGEFDREVAELVVRHPEGATSRGPVDRDGLERLLDDLVAADVLTCTARPDSPSYRFSHGLVEATARAALPRRVRIDLHRRIADWMLSAEIEDPSQLAVHLEAAGEHRRAVVEWNRAARAAIATARFADAAACARRALGLLVSLEAGTERDRVELRANMLLAVARKMTVSSDAELQVAVDRSVALAEALGRYDLLRTLAPILVASLQGSGRYAEAERRGSAALSLARSIGDIDLERVVCQYHWSTLVWMGRLAEASAVGAPDDGELADRPSRDPTGPPAIATEVLSTCARLALAGLVEFVRAQGESADEAFDRADLLARRTDVAEAICLTSATRAIACQLGGDAAATLALAEETLELSLQIGNDWWFVWGQLLLGWAVAAGGDPLAGVAMMDEALDHAGGVLQLRPYFGAVAASGELLAGRPDLALTRVREGAELAGRTGERFFLPYIRQVEAAALGALGAPDAQVAGARLESERLARQQGQLQFLRRTSPAPGGVRDDAARPVQA